MKKGIMKGFSKGYDAYKDVENDPSSRLLYIKMNPTTKTGGFMSKSEVDHSITANLAIYNVEKNELTYFFDPKEQKQISTFFYETEYHEENKRMYFNASINTCNNKEIAKRDCADKLFVCTENPEGNAFEFWKSSKNGSNKELLKSFNDQVSWSVDPLNKKIIFIEQLPNEVKVEAFDW